MKKTTKTIVIYILNEVFVSNNHFDFKKEKSLLIDSDAMRITYNFVGRACFHVNIFS